jgi:hypothetical protein
MAEDPAYAAGQQLRAAAAEFAQWAEAIVPSTLSGGDLAALLPRLQGALEAIQEATQAVPDHCSDTDRPLQAWLQEAAEFVGEGVTALWDAEYEEVGDARADTVFAVAAEQSLAARCRPASPVEQLAPERWRVRRGGLRPRGGA